MRILCAFGQDDHAPLTCIVIAQELGVLMISTPAFERLAFTQLSCSNLECAARCWRTRSATLVAVEVADLAAALRLLGRRQADVLEATSSLVRVPIN